MGDSLSYLDNLLVVAIFVFSLFLYFSMTLSNVF